MKPRTFVIGDIHGGYLGLVDVLEKANFDKEKDQLISLGDLCDGWPQTRETIDYMMSIKNLTLLRGNHDEWMIDFFKPEVDTNQILYDCWLSNGGKSTIESYTQTPGGVDWDLVKTHVEWLQSKSQTYHVQDNCLFVHAGYDPKQPIDQQDSDILLWDRGLWFGANHGLIDWSKITYDRVYIGHTPTRSPGPRTVSKITNMDTGAGYQGCLSVMDIHTGQIFQSDPLHLIYPDHPGRN